MTVSLAKKYLKTKPECKVTFELPMEAVKDAQRVCLVGEFNDWDTESLPMKRKRDGSFSLTMNLPKDSEHEFRYLIDNSKWENDWAADHYHHNHFAGTENSVVAV